MAMKRPTTEYRTVVVQPTDPPDEPEIQQQVLVTWDKIRNSSVISEGNELSIVYTADTREQLVAFLRTIGAVLIEETP